MLDYTSLALAASMLLAPAMAAPRPGSLAPRGPFPPLDYTVPEPKLHYSKASDKPVHNQKVLTSKNPNHGLVAGNAAYNLVDSYDSSNWMSKFSVQNIADPTHGYVTYVDQGTAQNDGLYQIQGSQVYIGVDHTTTLNPSGAGRNSVRLQSNTAYNHGIIIGDFAHIPGTECGSWPAFWMVGPNWPNSGEIDIIEGVNLQGTNQMTLHTSTGCDVTVGSGGQSGNTVATGCGDGGGYNGCGVTSNSEGSFGTPFDNNGGGVFATYWESDGIKIWWFPANGVPSDIQSGQPNPANWGQPQANFAGCDFDAHFSNLNIIFDITFCGDWAGQVWGNFPSCASSASSCQDYVAQNPSVYSDTYWLVNSVKVYQ